MIVLLIALFNFSIESLLSGFIQKANAASYTAGQLVQAANNSRQSAGLTLLTYNSKLEAAAYAKAADMLSKDYWSHFGPNGETPWQFFIAEGYIYQYAGENLGRGFSDANSLHNAWMASPTHYANIMKPEFREIGIAIVDGKLSGEDTTLVVQFFGTLPGSSSSSSSSENSTSSVQTSSISEQSTSTFTNSSETSYISSVSQNSAKSNSSSSVSSSVSKEILPPIAPILTLPADNSYFNTDSIQISGTAAEGEKVKVYKNDTELSETPILSGVWEYLNTSVLDEGTTSFKAKAVGSTGLLSEFSNLVNIIVDKTPVAIILEKISSRAESSYNKIFNLVLKLSSRDSNNFNISLKRNNVISQNFNWNSENSELELEIDVEKPEDLQIIVQDVAGNISTFSLSDQELKVKIYDFLKSQMGSDAKSYVFDNSNVDFGNSSNSVFDIKRFENSISTLSFKQKVNLSFASGLIILSLIDFLVLYKKKISIIRARNLFHIPQIAIIIILAIIHGFGTIL